MPEMNLFGATPADLLTLMNASPETGFTLDDAGGEAAVLALMAQAELRVLDALPDESARLLREIDDEVLCRAAEGTETALTLGGPDGLPSILAATVRLFRVPEEDAEPFLHAARTLTRPRWLRFAAHWELARGRDFTAERDAQTGLTAVRFPAASGLPARGDALVAAYRFAIDDTFAEPSLARLLLVRAAADLARRLGFDADFERFEREAAETAGRYASFEALPWSRKKLDLVRDRFVRAGAARSRVVVGCCARG